MRLHVNYACAIGTSPNLDPLCVAQNGIILELRRTAASQNRHSCQFADKQDETAMLFAPFRCTHEPPLSTLSAHAEPISQGCCWIWHHEAESLMTYMHH